MACYSYDILEITYIFYTKVLQIGLQVIVEKLQEALRSGPYINFANRSKEIIRDICFSSL